MTETTFTLEVKVEGYWNKQDNGRKIYVKGMTLKWIVDSDRFSLCELKNDLSEKLSWGSCQTPKTWMKQKNKETESLLESESQIVDMFKMYELEKTISLRVVVCDSDGSSRCSGTNAHPCTPAQPTPTVQVGSQSQAGSTHEEFLQYDDPNGDDYVALHDECIYYSDGDHHEVHVAEEVHIDSDDITLDSVHEESTIEGVLQNEMELTLDLENPKIEVGALFPDVYVFKKALRHYAIKNEFEVVTIKTDKKRFIGKCRNPSCPWRIHASVIQESKVFKVKVLPHEHTCPSTTMVDGNMVSRSWVSERVTDWMKQNPSVGAKDVKNKLESEFHVKVSYNKAWKGKEAALNQIHGNWEESFEILYIYKQELEKRCPGSIIEIDVERDGNKVRFSRIFVALKPCIDGFVHGCRPYLGIDSTHLTGKYKGQFLILLEHSRGQKLGSKRKRHSNSEGAEASVREISEATVAV